MFSKELRAGQGACFDALARAISSARPSRFACTVHAKRAGPANDPCFGGRAWAWAPVCHSVVRVDGVEHSAVVLVVVVTSLRVLVIVAVAVPAQRGEGGGVSA